MSTGRPRWLRVAGLEFARTARRPLVLVLVLIVVLSAWGLSSGKMRISSGDATVGGKKAWITSEHSNAYGFCFLTVLFYAFFVSVAAGTSITRDDELRVGEILHTTGLKPREYVWGKFAGITACFVAVLALQVVATIICQHLLPLEDADKIRGPFALGSYLRPAAAFALPTLLFLAGVTFWLGERTRRAVTVFLFPVGLMVVCAFFLWDWNPAWLDPRINRILSWIDPSGYRWLDETLLRVDRGVDYYNTQPVRWDAGFIASRLGLVAVGLGAVAWSARHFARTLRGAAARKARARAQVEATVADPFAGTVDVPSTAARGSFATLDMRAGRTSFIRELLTIARFEIAGLASSAGLYLFAPLILMQTLMTAYYAEGVWGTRLIVTSGSFAIGTFNALSLCTVLLLLFYTVESLDRENATGLAPLYASTPVRSAAMLFGKALANCFVGLVILLAAGLGAVAIMLAQGRVRPEAFPFVIVWGLLLAPTLLFWSSFVMAVMALVRSKYATYGIALGVLILTGVLQFLGKMNWVWNWNLWSAALWSDMGLLEPNLRPLLLNRLLYTGLAVLCLAIAVRLLPRRELDATRIVHRLAPRSLLRNGLRLAPYAAVPLVVAIYLGNQVANGFQSKRARMRDRDYWKQNLATWKDAPKPAILHADLAVSLEPREHSFHTAGTYDLFNAARVPLRQIALTLGGHVPSCVWTLDGVGFEPENRTGLFVFDLPQPLAPGDTVRVGFDFGGRLPRGVTRNGQGMREFIEPSGVVLTSFSPTFVPLVGFQEDIGVDPKENQYEPRLYPDDWYLGEVQAPLGLHRRSTTRIALEGPSEYTYNSVGRCVADTIQAGRRHTVWESDQPVYFFNVVAGKWAERRGTGTVLYYHPTHRYNIEEMGLALDGARRYFSEWFHPYPWQELKVSQFANLARYAQGFPTNITFAEDIGFLTLSDRRTRVAFTVTAHEAAHQWWGNLLMPGDAPGGDILSEGMAHFSTLLLHEQMNGAQGRMEFAKRIEERYGDARHVDAERPLVKIDGSREGDQTVTYDKGGWVFWMLHDLMGREANLAGLRALLANHLDNPDHALLQDFVAEMRPFAPDSTAYDAFTRQWFFEVVAPQYELEDVQRVTEGAGWIVTGTLQNAGSGRMPIEIAVVSGERFVEPARDAGQPVMASVDPKFREARARFTLGAGESAPFRVECDFEPHDLIVDPDVRVLQLRRKYAVHHFGSLVASR